MSPTERSQTYAAVDLGSNSFHLLVSRREHGQLLVIDQIKEMVRLAGGLDNHGKLDQETTDSAHACLARFGQRLRGIPDDNIRAVGTQTFRRLRNVNAFLMVAETALGCSIDIIGGREEARLIYLGVSQGVSSHDGRRLVVDIGGGSTELIIGEGTAPMEMESVQYGCVSLTRQFFSNGRITRGQWKNARRSVLADLQEMKIRYRQTGWETTVGSSGTIRAVASICEQQGWCERGITSTALDRLVRTMIEFGTIGNVRLAGLSERRHPVLIGGLVVLAACFEAFRLKSMEVSPFALREGLLHDLLGRLEHRDPRDNTVAAFKKRYGVDAEQVTRVKSCALKACEQISDGMFLRPVHRDLLGWAADLHETGLGVSHSHFQRHSAYLVEHADMPGFSTQEQLFLAALIGNHRGVVANGFTERLPTRLHEPLRVTLFCLRFASILCRSREDTAVPKFTLAAQDHSFAIGFTGKWAREHPLTVADLEGEVEMLRKIGLRLKFSYHPTSQPA
jgi:exopolyphosphatase/guanosine-5'-triphosphate,3'-diphosphate pyrophosphatase